MNAILEKLKGAQATDRRKRLDRYVELLKLGEAATAEQVGELQGLMAVLGLDTAKVEADSRALSDRAHYLKMIESAPEKERVKNAAAAALTKHLARMDQIIKQLEAEKQRLITDRNQAESAYFAAARCLRLIFELDGKNWELFGIPQPEQPKAFGLTDGYMPPSARCGDSFPVK